MSAPAAAAAAQFDWCIVASAERSWRFAVALVLWCLYSDVLAGCATAFVAFEFEAVLASVESVLAAFVFPFEFVVAVRNIVVVFDVVADS